MVVWNNVVLVLWATFWIYWLFLGIKTRAEVPVESRGQSRIGRAIQLACVILSMYLILGFHDSTRIFLVGIPLLILGINILCVSLTFAVWARLILAKNWSAAIQFVQKQQLIQKGPYKLIRHPIYTGVIGGFLGTMLVQGTVVSIAAFLIILIVYCVKIFYEERFLLTQFGGNYAEYKKKTWALIPFVY